MGIHNGYPFIFLYGGIMYKRYYLSTASVKETYLVESDGCYKNNPCYNGLLEIHLDDDNYYVVSYSLRMNRDIITQSNIKRRIYNHIEDAMEDFIYRCKDIEIWCKKLEKILNNQYATKKHYYSFIQDLEENG